MPPFMIFKVHSIPIYFPYPSISYEQLYYIKETIKSFSTATNLFIEMHAGSGKTICILSAAISYQLDKAAKSEEVRFVYCTRTVQETEKTLMELKRLINYVKKHRSFRFLGMGLTSRKHLCVNEGLSGNVEIECRKLLSSGGCEYFDKVEDIVERGERDSRKAHIKNVVNSGSLEGGNANNSSCDLFSLDGVYSFDEIRQRGRDVGFCPYFLTRKLLSTTDFLILTYNYVLDPKIKEKINLPNDPILIFDEAHNIDNACLEAFSFEISRNVVNGCGKGLEVMEEIIKNSNKKEEKDSGDAFPNDIESFSRGIKKFPGNLRKEIHVLSILKRILEFLKIKLKSTHLTINNTSNFLNSLYALTFVNKKTLCFLKKRYQLISLPFDENVDKLNVLIDFVDTLTTYSNSNAFSVIFEPLLTNFSLSPKLTLSCNDSRIAVKNLRFRSLLITSGTLTPFDVYMKLLGISGKSVSIKGSKKEVLIVSKGNDQINISNDVSHEQKTTNDQNVGFSGPSAEQKNTALSTYDINFNNNLKDFNTALLSSSFKLRGNSSTIRNYVTLIKDLCQIVPDGLIIFFPSYIFMHEILSRINNLVKLIFIETINYKESINALTNYKKAIRQGKGAIMFCVARGKVSEGIDFKNEEGRCVLVVGVPFAFTESVVIKERLKYLKTNLNLNSYLQFDALRHALQCLGRVVRGKNDYGLMVMADHRYNNYHNLFADYDVIDGLSVDMCVNIGKTFFRKMANKKEEQMMSEEEVQKALGN